MARATGYISAFPAPNRAEPCLALVRLFLRLHMATRRKLKRLHSDGAKALSAATPLCLENQQGTSRTVSVPHSPQINGQEERAIGVRKNDVRSALRAANVSCKFWDSAQSGCADKHNVIPKSGKHNLCMSDSSRELPCHFLDSFRLVHLVTFWTLHNQRAL